MNLEVAHETTRALQNKEAKMGQKVEKKRCKKCKHRRISGMTASSMKKICCDFFWNLIDTNKEKGSQKQKEEDKKKNEPKDFVVAMQDSAKLDVAEGVNLLTLPSCLLLRCSCTVQCLCSTS